jgi:hypothetical protein
MPHIPPPTRSTIRISPKPGTILVNEGTTGGAKVHSEFAVTHKIVTILGVTSVEVHDTVFTNGELTEDTQDRQANVWYF